MINNFGGYYHTWLYFNEARILGAELKLPSVNHSRYKSRLIGKRIYVGWIHIQNLERKLAWRMEKELRTNGAFQHLADFVDRVAVGLEQLILLIRVGAFGFLNKTKAELLWQAHMLLHKHKPKAQQEKLFQSTVSHYRLPDFKPHRVEDAYDEMELLGFPLSLSFFDLLQTTYRATIKAEHLPELVGKKVKMLGQLVTIKYVKTVHKEYMNFGTFIDDSGRFFDTVHFPNTLKYYPFKGDGVYLILGKVVEEFGFASLEVEKMAKMPIKPDPRA